MKYTLELLGRPELSIDLTELAGTTSYREVIDRGRVQIAKLAAGEIEPADADRALRLARGTYEKFEASFLSGA